MLDVIRQMLRYGWMVEFSELGNKTYARAHYKNNTKKEQLASGNTLEDALNNLRMKVSF